jgi:hypothetical protein
VDPVAEQQERRSDDDAAEAAEDAERDGNREQMHAKQFTLVPP